MKLLIKTLIMFVLMFMLFFPLSIVMDETFSHIDVVAGTYGNSTADPTNFTGNITTHTSFFGNVFRIIYSIAGIGIIVNLVLIAILRREDSYEYYEN